MRTFITHAVLIGVFVFGLPSLGEAARDGSKGKGSPYQAGILLARNHQIRVVSNIGTFGGGVSIPYDYKMKYYFFWLQAGSTVYTLRYSTRLDEDPKPPWKAGKRIWFRIRKKRIYLRLPDGKELKTVIVRKDA